MIEPGLERTCLINLALLITHPNRPKPPQTTPNPGNPCKGNRLGLPLNLPLNPQPSTLTGI